MTVEDKPTLREYAAQRARLLDQITQSLSGDPRFVAAWLSGSVARGEADDVSDLDLTVVISKGFARHLCTRPDMITVRPPSERLTLFEQYGDIGFVYENNYNAPGSGTATTVMYLPSGINVDWTLISEDEAQRPPASQVLFARRDVPGAHAPGPVSPSEQAKAITDMVGFFWLMAAVTAKYIIRGDQVFVVRWLEELAGLVQAAERQLAGQVWQYRRGSLTALKATRAEQLTLLRDLCERVEALSPRVVALGGDVWPTATVGVGRLLTLAEQVTSSALSAG